MKSKNLAAILALAGGSIGLHKFYTGQVGAGIFYVVLMFVTAGIVPAILGVIDAVKLFSMSQQQFDRIYNESRPSGRNMPRQRRRTQRQEDIHMERQRSNSSKISAKQRNNPFRKSADKKFEEYDLDGALDDYKKATEITPADNEMHFNLACIYSLKEEVDQSLHHLDMARKMGFVDVEKIKTKDELAYLRIQPEYDAFVNNGYRQQRVPGTTPPKEDLLQNDALLAQLNKLKEMRERGLLSEKEFSYEKERLTRRRK